MNHKQKKLKDTSCPLNKCLNGGQCSTRLNGNFHCECSLPFDGATCDNG